MSNIVKKIIVLTCVLVGLFFFAAFLFNQKSPTVGINNIINEYHLPSAIGIQVQSMNTGKILYRKNSDHLFMPASNLKLFTAVAALLYLKPDYQIQTTLSTDAQKIIKSVLYGNVYLTFNGDPVLTKEDLNNLISTLQQKKIQTIRGNFYIDEQSADNKKYGPGWMWDDLDSCYSAPIGTIMINQNCFDSTLMPAQKINDKALLQSPENNSLTPISNHVVTIKNTDSSNCPLELKSDRQNHYLLTGCLPLNSKSIDLEIAIKNPARYAEELVKELLQANHIQLTGKILNEKSPGSATLLAAHYSPELSALIRTMLKDSNNQIADALLMLLSKNYYHQDATWQSGVNAVQMILWKQAHINLSLANIVDGSGQSTYNLVTPEQISQLLYFAYHNSILKSSLLSALPIAGVDGTLKSRMTSEYLNGNLRAKTGTLTGVSSLSGYIKTINGQTLSFVILVNNFLGKNSSYVETMEDTIANFLFSI